MINMVSAIACAPPLTASVDEFAGRQVNELEDDAVSLTAVGISALTAVELSGPIDQLEAPRAAITHSRQHHQQPSTCSTPGS